MTRMLLRSIAAAAAMLASLAVSPASAETIKLGVGGRSMVYYLPLTIADRMGYFRQEGLDVEIVDLGSGSKALQAMMGRSVDVTVGAYDHTVQMQAKQQPIRAVVGLGRYPGIVLGVVKHRMAGYRGHGDLKGMKVGVTAPGSGTAFMVSHILMQNGMKSDDVLFVGLGAGPGAIAAVKRGEVDAIAHLDPVITQLESEGELRVVLDSRTLEGSKAVYGGEYPAAVLYMRDSFIEANQSTTQRLVTAFVRALKWLATATPQQIADTIPPEFIGPDRKLYISALTQSRDIYSPDGFINRHAAENAIKTLKVFDMSVGAADIRVDETFTNDFVKVANQTLK